MHCFSENQRIYNHPALQIQGAFENLNSMLWNWNWKWDSIQTERFQRKYQRDLTYKADLITCFSNNTIKYQKLEKYGIM